MNAFVLNVLDTAGVGEGAMKAWRNLVTEPSVNLLQLHL
jgi:hypothetical protein